MAGYEVLLESGNDVTESYLTAIQGQDSPAILHIATHGYYWNDSSNWVRPGRYHEIDHPLIKSGLILSGANRLWGETEPIVGVEDGIMTAIEIADLDFRNFELVVLSSCNSGLGDINSVGAVEGLSSAFKIAGAKRILVSMAPVGDNDANEFMQLFYRNLIATKQFSDAFNATRKEMRRRYPKAPEKWASWVMIR
jgi:CHAT domain-containing protein